MQTAIIDQAALRATFERWHAQYREPISRSIARMLRDHALVEDVTQETFVRLWRMLVSKGSIEHPQAYLYRIATNLCHDHARRQRRVCWQVLEHEHLHQGIFPDPQEHYGTRERLLQTLERMPARYRAALLLYYEQGYSYAQLAQALDIAPSESGVKMYLTRARRCFRECYATLA